jgi:hypothetical protein
LDQLEKNDVDVAKFVHSQCRRRAPDSANDVQEILFKIADLTNRGIIPGAKFRTWKIAANQTSLTGGPAISGPEAKVPPQKIEEAVYDFAAMVLNRWPELNEDPVPLAAWAEWQLNGGTLHPFYDGCGRISRSFAATLLVTADSLLPLFDNSANYFTAGNRGLASFIGYYAEQFEACKRWISVRASSPQHSTDTPVSLT